MGRVPGARDGSAAAGQRGTLMPTAAAHPCPGCQRLIQQRGRCPACSRTQEVARGTSTQRGYDMTWQRFRDYFSAELIAHGITRVCGAALPGGPKTQDSLCQHQGLLTFKSSDGSDLCYDHEPALQHHERHDVSAKCNVLRIQLLCSSCHAHKSDTWQSHRAPYQGGDQFC